jgi:hypothetical protein
MDKTITELFERLEGLKRSQEGRASIYNLKDSDIQHYISTV